MPRAKDAELESAFHTWKDEERRVRTLFHTLFNLLSSSQLMNISSP